MPKKPMSSATPRTTSKRSFRETRHAEDHAAYPDLEASSGGKWVKRIAGAVTGAALMAFCVSCFTDGDMQGPPTPYDLAQEAAVDLDVTPDTDRLDAAPANLDSGVD